MCTVHKQVISHGGVSFELPAAVHQTLSKSNNGGDKKKSLLLLSLGTNPACESFYFVRIFLSCAP